MIKLKHIMEGKFDPYKAKSLTFVTYGGLSATKQLGFKKSTTFHAPPARRGIYAFVWPYIERFLLGSVYADPKYRGKGQRQRATYVKDKDGNPITSDHPEYEKASQVNKNWSFTRTQDNKPWDREENDWEKEKPVQVLYQNAARKKFQYSGDIWHHLTNVPEHTVINRHGDWVKTDMKTFMDALRKELVVIKKQHYSKDHLEVFIDEKI
jgi:hypothetical protein